MKNKIIIAGICIAFAIGFSMCELEDEPTPTRKLMEGVWEVTEAYDSSGNSIVDKVNFLVPTYVQFTDYMTINTTAGPLFMYIVYGDSKFIQVTSKLDAAFDYLNYQWTPGNYGVHDGVQETFNIEVEMKFPGTQTLEEILDIMGVNYSQFFTPVIRHTFRNVSIDLTDDDPDKMIITFDNNVEPTYQVKDPDLVYQNWYGVSWEFTRCYFVLEKRSKTLMELMDEQQK
jgi:hypothetical protein